MVFDLCECGRCAFGMALDVYAGRREARSLCKRLRLEPAPAHRACRIKTERGADRMADRASSDHDHGSRKCSIFGEGDDH